MKKLICLLLAAIVVLSGISTIAETAQEPTLSPVHIVRLTIDELVQKYFPSWKLSENALEIEEIEDGYAFSAKSSKCAVSGTTDSDRVIREIRYASVGVNAGEKLFNSYGQEYIDELYNCMLQNNYSSLGSTQLSLGSNLLSFSIFFIDLAYPTMAETDVDGFLNNLYAAFNDLSECRDIERQLNGWRYKFEIVDSDYVFTARTVDGISLKTTDDVQPVEGGFWSYLQSVDEFGDPSDGGFIMGEFTGTFSSTATQSSDLSVIAYFSGEMMDFRFIEANSTKATYTSGEARAIQMKIKVDSEVQEFVMTGTAPNGDLTLSCFYNENYPDFVQKIYDGKEISCVVYIGSSKYNFKMNGLGFAQCYNSLSL